VQPVKFFWKSFYRYFILPILWGGFHFLGLFHHKIRKGLQGRRGLDERARDMRMRLGDEPLLLFHCASMGEFEALHPLAKKLASRIALGVIYFSPSAEITAKKSDVFSFADYSPQDTRRAVRKFLRSLKPLALVITKHDVWPNLIWECQAADIPVFLVNASFPLSSKRFWPVIRSFQRVLTRSFRAILAVSPEDAKRARRITPADVPILIAGDSRYDRVTERIDRAAAEIPFPQQSFAGRFVLVAGSTHAADEAIVLPAVASILQRHSHLFCLLVPHDPIPSALKNIQTTCEAAGLNVRMLSEWNGGELGQVLCVDRVGILAALYGLGHLAYIGGGFDKGVHSVLEPMAYSLPVLTSPKIEVSHEARMAKELGILQVAFDATQVETWIERFVEDENARNQTSEKARVFMSERLGASERIVDFLRKELKLP
jgi:3-deoxy-D-manno-octulosonic-acid transferase